MDILSDVLGRVQLRSTVHTSPELCAPWGIAFGPQADRAQFYVISRGSCYLELAGQEQPLPLVGGDLVMLPHGNAHILRDRPQSRAIPFEQLFQHDPEGKDCRPMLPHGGAGERTILVGGHFQFASRAAGYFLSSLPPLIHIRAEDGMRIPWLEATLKFLAAESLADTLGSQLITARLVDVLLVQILRAFIEQSGKEQTGCSRRVGFLRALVDPELGRALVLIHQTPEHPWTVAELADRVGMSRTAFAVRFSSLTGISPLQYLTRWRMDIARELLDKNEESLEGIARKVGYDSGAAFSKAFKRETGQSPGQFRRHLEAVEA